MPHPSSPDGRARAGPDAGAHGDRDRRAGPWHRGTGAGGDPAARRRARVPAARAHRPGRGRPRCPAASSTSRSTATTSRPWDPARSSVRPACPTSTARRWRSWTTCSTPAARCGRRSTSAPTSAGPRRILLCVLIDRGGRELPIQADIVGKTGDRRAGRAGGRAGVASSTAATRSSWCAADDAPTLGKDLVGLEPLSREQILLILDTAEPFKEVSERRHQEGAGAPRQDHRQSLLRGLHPHPDLVRVRREAAQRRHGERGHRRQLGEQGRDAGGHRPQSRGDADRHGGDPPRRVRRGAVPRPADPLQRDQRRRRQARASRPRACSTCSRCATGSSGSRASRSPSAATSCTAAWPAATSGA